MVAAVAGTAFAAPLTRLVISGALHTTSARVVAHDEGCGFKTKARILSYLSNAMRIGRGPAVARVEFFIPRYRGRGHYDARIPAPYNRTAVQVVIGRNATTGVGSFYSATSGSVTVVQSKNVGRPWHSGLVSGTVHAKLRHKRSAKGLRVDGSWHCRIDTESNGG